MEKNNLFYISKVGDRIFQICIYTLFVIPLIILPLSFFGDWCELPKLIFTFTIGIIGFLFVILKRDFFLSISFFIMFLFLMVNVLLYFYHPVKYFGIERLKEVFVYLAFIILGNNLPKNIKKRSLQFGIIISSIIAIIGIYQKMSGVTRVFSTMGHPNFLAAYLTLFIPLAFYFAIFEKQKIFFISLLALLFCLILTGSKGGWIGSISALTFFFYSIRKKFIMEKYSRVTAIILLSFIVIGGFRIYKIRKNELKESFLPRLMLWEVSSKMIKEKPILGYGPGGFAVYNNLYQGKIKKNYLSFLNKNPYLSIRNPRNVHNEFLQVWIETGVFGFLIFILFVMQITIIPLMKESLPLIDLAILSALLGIILESLFSFPLQVPGINGIFFLMVGISESKKWKIRNKLKLPGNKINNSIITISIILTTFLFIVKPLFAEYYFTKYSKTGKFSDAKDALKWGYKKPEIYFMLTQDYLNSNRLEKSFYYCRKLLKLEPYHEISHFLLGEIYWKTGNLKSAEQEYRKSIDLEPLNSLPYIRLSDIYLNQTPQKSLNILNNALYYLSASSDIYNELGVVYAYLGDKEKALKNLVKAEKISKNNVIAISNEFVLEQNLPIKFLINSKSYEWIMKKNAIILYYKNKGKMAMAKQICKQIIYRYPSYIPALISLGTIYYRIGEIDSAKIEWEKAYNISPELVSKYLEKNGIKIKYP